MQARKNTNLVENVKEINNRFHTFIQLVPVMCITSVLTFMTSVLTFMTPVLTFITSVLIFIIYKRV